MTRDRALQAAVALADAGGIDSLSMRRLARQLGVEAMSLYYHVNSKNEILDGMVEIVVGQMTLTVVDTPWRVALRERAESARAVLRQHPWAISQISARTTRATMAFHDATIGCLLASGFSMPLAAHALSIIDSYVHGFALQEASLPFDNSGDIGAVTEAILAEHEEAAESFPHLTRMASTLILKPGYAYGHEFEFGLGLILDGLETAHTAESGPRPPASPSSAA